MLPRALDALSRRSLLAALGALGGLELLGNDAHAAPDDSGPRKFIDGRLKELRTHLRQPKSPARDAKLKEVFDRMLDYEYFVRATLGKYYATLTPEQIDEFSVALKQLFQNAYTNKLKQPERYLISFTGEVPAEAGTLVQTTVKDKTSADQPLSVAYVVALVDGKWRARDIVTDTVSLAKNYRRQFARILKKPGGFKRLMELMNKKLAKENAATK